MLAEDSLKLSLCYYLAFHGFRFIDFDCLPFTALTVLLIKCLCTRELEIAHVNVFNLGVLSIHFFRINLDNIPCDGMQGF